MYCCHLSCVVTASSIVVSPLPSNWIVKTLFLASCVVSATPTAVPSTHIFNLEQVLIRPDHRFGLDPVCNLLACGRLLVDPVSSQKGTQLLTLQVANDRLDLVSVSNHVTHELLTCLIIVLSTRSRVNMM